MQLHKDLDSVTIYMYVCVRTYTLYSYIFYFLVIFIITNYENNTFSLNSIAIQRLRRIHLIFWCITIHNL